jgi:hypothetical protein
VNRYDFDWTLKPVDNIKHGIATASYLATRALGVVYKNFLIPMENLDLNSWKKNDHYRHHLPELEALTGDEVWIKPWIVGGWLQDKECIYQFEPTEFNDKTFESSLLAELNHWRLHHRRGALFGFYLTINRPNDFQAIFMFKVNDPTDAEKLNDLLIREAMCHTITGNTKKIEEWLDWAYREGRIA